MSGDGRDDPVDGGAGGPEGPSARQVPSQGGPANVPSGAEASVPQQREGRAGHPSSGPQDEPGPPAPPSVPQQGSAGARTLPEDDDTAGGHGRHRRPDVHGDAADGVRDLPGPGGPAPASPDGQSPPAEDGVPAAPGPADAVVPPLPHSAWGDLPPSDSDLIRLMRSGDDRAYEELFRRHAAAVRRYARTCCRDAHTADDLTAEVFVRTLQAVRGGSGPQQAVRAYLLTTVRRVAAAWTKSARREHLVDDFAVFASQAARSSSSSLDDDTLELGADVRAMHEADQSLAMQAFRSLPERWQAVLWHTTVEDESPSQIAPLFGLSPNATAVLAGRAREGLKQAYLQAHVSTALTSGGDCARYADRLGAYARGGLRMRAERGLRKHLAECAKCRLAAGELAVMNTEIPGRVPIAVIGWLATGYSLKAAGVIGGTTAGAAGAAGAAGGGSGAGASGGSTAGGAASEGVGASVKAAVAALVAVAAAAGLVWALTGGDHRPPPRTDAKPPTAQSLVPQIPMPSHAPPHKTAPPASPHTRSTSPHATPPPSSPSASPSATPSPERAPAPHTSAPASPKPPAPSVSPKPPSTSPASPPPPSAPPATVYQVSMLRYGFQGRSDAPLLRLGATGLLWQRSGLSVGGVPYDDGVSTHAPSSVTIDLNRSCSSFQAQVGVDDLTRGLGTLRFSVYGDSTRLWTSAPVRGGQAAVPVDVGIGGRRSIRLTVEPGTPFSVVAVADWARARITCG